ncbi:uncharacterized protein LAESUDRAFT_14697 [Laetiporus sulphureus 93-53]|uniref:Uncharacterized protein n=1 Tax=Laetiporus sulphureus 93-53 TaxID=1314785 RepID=A0A165I909_9APHY|nr:uncharacterized protein LAESUDRAFT_14697 [Laetiporus sulphureus 93-53]KZT12750.1 hypothetical protein LAESUDRAFT_14697 [Laetiporus sulphureus 93-53]
MCGPSITRARRSTFNVQAAGKKRSALGTHCITWILFLSAMSSSSASSAVMNICESPASIGRSELSLSARNMRASHRLLWEPSSLPGESQPRSKGVRTAAVPRCPVHLQLREVHASSTFISCYTRFVAIR